MNKSKEKTKESFCPACIAVPLALAGASASAAGANQNGNHKQRKKIMLWGGIASIVISILIMVYFLFIKKCKSCI